MAKYKKRVMDEILERRLRNKSAIVIEGTKWCGKTTTAEKQAASILYMSDPDTKEQNLLLADISPKMLLQGEAPRLIDEWQLAPKLWDAVRFEADHRDDLGQFMLTGSAVPPNTAEIHHTGTGRFAWLKMRPMSLWESGDSNGEISLEELFEEPTEDFFAQNNLDLENLAYLTCRGGWPRATTLEGDDALEQAFDYYEAVTKADISRVDGIKRDEQRVRQLMRSYARHQGTQVSSEAICEDMKTNGKGDASRDTVNSYLSALRKIFVIEDMAAWNPNLRSKTAIRTSNTHYFVDPSIAAAALGIGPGDLINDLNTYGLLFETLCVRDLRIFAEAINGEVYHYRDKSGLECDAVVHLRNGSYGLVEIKLGGDKSIEEGARSLKALSNLIDTNKMKSPSFLMVLVGTAPYAYKREDGVYIVPIGCLKN